MVAKVTKIVKAALTKKKTGKMHAACVARFLLHFHVALLKLIYASTTWTFNCNKCLIFSRFSQTCFCQSNCRSLVYWLQIKPYDVNGTEQLQINFDGPNGCFLKNFRWRCLHSHYKLSNQKMRKDIVIYQITTRTLYLQQGVYFKGSCAKSFLFIIIYVWNNRLT